MNEVFITISEIRFVVNYYLGVPMFCRPPTIEVNGEDFPAIETIGSWELSADLIQNGPIALGERVVGPYGNFMITEQYPNGSTFNYYSGGDIESILGVSLNGYTLGGLGIK